jgi:hypothetical protein
MKKIVLFLILITSSLISCSSDESSSSADSNFKWSCKVDGVLYSWQGSFTDMAVNGGGFCQFSKPSDNICQISLLTGQPLDQNSIDISITIPGSGNTGTYDINSSNGNLNNNFSLGGLYGFPMVHSVYQSTDGIVVKINSITNTNIQSGSFGKVKGTFSGRVSNYNGTSVNITNGSFEAMNMNY